jgi:anhydro-N-acetylmuramic acid kinase
MARYFIGLMSGTSLDGIDAAVASFDDGVRMLATHYQPFDPALRDTLFALQTPGDNEIHRAAIAANQLTHAYASATREVLAKTTLTAGDIDAIGCHGQTVRHQPAAGYTTQLVNGALLAELTGITVAADFRSRDIAAGGQGAPLAPAFHREMFGSPDEHRVIVNVGGIANLTDLPANGDVSGFDCGPGNALMDGWTQEHLGRNYDTDGAWAASGVILPKLFKYLILNDFFYMAPPKSTGRELVNLAWARQALGGNERPQDVQATLLELTAQTIARAIAQYCIGTQAVYVCGGGAHNRALMARLNTLLPAQRVTSTTELGLSVDWVEAVAFAWLARQTLLHQPGNLPAVTGARGARVLGAIYPV